MKVPRAIKSALSWLLPDIWRDGRLEGLDDAVDQWETVQRIRDERYDLARSIGVPANVKEAVARWAQDVGSDTVIISTTGCPRDGRYEITRNISVVVDTIDERGEP